ncbi:MAG: hypothetical protein DRJ31_03050 [Candidatus Methanomethylicota archaeon]|uniref:DUF2116 family Zn-ribbon domain-containing protein n=1 Tax=Thermoproteota archaeon TaxID=2056631 RepID=A0A497ESD5_9CREN|nr:MAG: hypothetical protein DRJ31_03050 [Candidatus Verstraetearchaeota archaeon]RLE52547.1 MAG: hypothetical protein DRJ33_03490 [Candidatus Verstraetearchaeota archaeon]
MPSGKQAKEQESSEQPYIYPHRHCVICGKMIEVLDRPYCLKCKAEYERRMKREKRLEALQKTAMIFAVAFPLAIAIFYALHVLGYM